MKYEDVEYMVNRAIEADHEKRKYELGSDTLQ